jgi:uncharacterized protein YggE
MRYPVVSVFSLAACFVSPLRAQIPAIQPALPEINASGRGDVLVSPDRARLSVTVESRAESAVEAASNNAATIARTIAALKAVGATDQDIKTSGYSVWTDFDKDGRHIRAFGARNTLRVEVLKIGDLGRFVDAALKGGATQLQPIQYLGPKIDQARHEAMALAVANARGDAKVLAESAGGSLGDLISLTSTNNSPGNYQEVVLTGLASSVIGGTPTSIVPSDLLVSATAFGKWRYLQR